jgi:hypothetical protein
MKALINVFAKHLTKITFIHKGRGQIKDKSYILALW